MDNDGEKRRSMALFRYELITSILQENVENQMVCLRELASQEHLVPHVGKRKFSVYTLKRWLRKYRRAGFKA